MRTVGESASTLRARAADGRGRRLRVLFRAAALAATLAPTGCFTMQHTVGRGPQHDPPIESTGKCWFGLFGFWPVQDYDSHWAGVDTRDYRVTTKFTFDDVVMSAFTSFATFYRQTVIVEK